jgi:hypothetical protein
MPSPAPPHELVRKGRYDTYWQGEREIPGGLEAAG